MIRIAVTVLAIVWSHSALPCTTPIDPQAAIRADRAEQRRLVTELTAQADAILIVKAEVVVRSSDGGYAQFRVQSVLKGTAKEDELLGFELPQLLTIGCGAAAMFKNVWAQEGIEYILYAQGGRLLRTGEMERYWPHISARQEIHEIRKTLKRLDV